MEIYNDEVEDEIALLGHAVISRGIYVDEAIYECVLQYIHI